MRMLTERSECQPRRRIRAPRCGLPACRGRPRARPLDILTSDEGSPSQLRLVVQSRDAGLANVSEKWTEVSLTRAFGSLKMMGCVRR
jgi:hypothetical protein